MGFKQNCGGDSRCWGFSCSGWEAVGSGGYGGCGGCMSGRRWTKATDGAGSRSLGVVECAAGTGPAMLLTAAQPQDLVKVRFLAGCFTD